MKLFENVRLSGTQIVVRDFLLQDIDTYTHWQKPGHKWQLLDAPYYKTDLDESVKLGESLKDKILNSNFPNPRMRLAIVDIKNDKLIGVVSSYWESKETNWLCIGIIIYDDQEWGRGLGTESMKLWINYLFESHPEIVRLDMRTWSGNLGLMKLAEKLGFQQEACFRKARIVNNEYYDGLGFGLLKDEWQLTHK